MRAALAPDSDDRAPFTVASLASRWHCSEGLVRKLVKDERLAAFRIGDLIRIAAAEVERFECQSQPSTASNDSATDLPSSGGRAVSGDDGSSRREIDRAPRRKRDASGKARTVVPGPWGAS